MPFSSLDGPTFVGVYILLLLVASIAGVRIARGSRRSVAADTRVALGLPAEEVAFLSGGPDAAIASALSSLVSRSLVRYHEKTERLSAIGETDGEAGAFERTVHGALLGRSAGPITLRDRLQPVLGDIRMRLTNAGLLLDQTVRSKRRLAACAPLVVVLFLGLARLNSGVDRGRPVGLLSLLLMVGLMIPFFVVPQVPERTVTGDAALASLRETHAALEATARSRSSALTPGDLGLAVGLFGLTVLQGTALAGLGVMLMPATASGSSGSGSCSSGGDGCGGGGCGGCGS